MTKWISNIPKKILVVIGGLIILFITFRPTMQNTSQSLNGKWLMRYDPENIGLQSGFEKCDTDYNGWHSVTIPTFWDDSGYDGIGWFVQKFIPKRNLKNRKVALVFDSVDDNAIVFLNGKRVYEHTGANVRFYFDVTSEMKIGEENLLVVRVEDTGGAGGLNGNVSIKTYQNETDLLMTEHSKQEAITVPEWVKDAVIYELYVRTYSSEGTFDAVTTDIPRLQKLGISCIWLMPIFPVGETNRKGTLGSPYAIRNFTAVNPEFGTESDFGELIQAAHQAGIRVILDIACNHSAWDNPWLSEHPDWYTQDSSGEIISPNEDWTDVADLNYDNDGLRKAMIEALESWVKNFNIDGYRMDVAEMVPNDFWEEALPRLQKIKPDILMLAEGDQPGLHSSAFHLTYAWNTRHILHKILVTGSLATDLFKDLEKEYYRYPKNSVRMRFTENHDEPRSAAFFGKQQARVAAAIVFTLPGVPMIYNGQEIGESIVPSLFEKSGINWRRGDSATENLFSDLIALRRSSISLRRGSFSPLINSLPEKIVSFMRFTEAETMLIVVNMSPEIESCKISLKDIYGKSTGKNLELKIGHPEFSMKNDTLSVRLKPGDFGIFEI
ncbi:MAG: alpha-amylase family glycosyl hydrolase [Candidatus Marinimicrobia bacterium]|nr:alpha-amylase family glycosyl hydrolase [Candidatus Neomarinimicrobiota bacterium]